MPEPTTETLAVWLRDVVATVPDGEMLKAFQAAVLVGAKCSGLEALDVIALGHQAAETKVQWFADLARTKDAPVPNVGNKALVTRLAAASTVRQLTSGGMPAVVAGLASQSAAFLDLAPDLPELTSFADAAVLAAGSAARARPAAYQAAGRQVPGWVDGAQAPPAEGTPASDRPQWERPTAQLAEHIDVFAQGVQDWLKLLDEEYNLLWWSHAGRSLTADTAWDEVTPVARRVALVGHELAGQTRIPATAMVDGLAAVALGGAAGRQLALADVVIAARDEQITLAAVDHRLLPISTAVTQAKIYSEDDTWKTVVKKVHGIDVRMKRSAVQITRQLIREHHLGKLL